MTTQKNTESKVIDVKSIFGKFPKIDANSMKVADRAAYSALVGSLAKDNLASIDIPLALNASGKELFNVSRIERVFYAVNAFYDKKVSIGITERAGLDGDNFYTITIARQKDEFTLSTRVADKTELKVESSKKRVEKAQENKQKKENEITAQVEERAQVVAKKQLEEQTNFLAQKINKAITARFKQWNIAISDDKMKMLQNDIVAIIQNS